MSSSTAPSSLTPTALVNACMREWSDMLCSRDGLIQPAALPLLVQRAEDLEVRVLSGTASKLAGSATLPTPAIPLADRVTAPPFPCAWFHWLALAYLNLNAPVMAQAALARLADLFGSDYQDEVARYLWSASNHHIRAHYETAFDHLRRAEEAFRKSQPEGELGSTVNSDSWCAATTAALLTHTANTIAMRQYCSYRSCFCAEQDTPECLETCAAQLNLSEEDVKARLARWCAADATVQKICGPVLNAYGLPWCPYDSFGTGEAPSERTTTEAYVRMAVNTASLATPSY